MNVKLKIGAKFAESVRYLKPSHNVNILTVNFGTLYHVNFVQRKMDLASVQASYPHPFLKSDTNCSNVPAAIEPRILFMRS